MISKIKSITATILLTLTSAMSYLVFCYTCLLIGGAMYSAEKDSFDKYSLVELLFGLQIVLTFVFTYISSIVYLCRQLYKIKKWMVIIPVLYSILIFALGITFIWWDYQLI